MIKYYNLIYVMDGEIKQYNSYLMTPLEAGCCLLMFERNYINNAGGGRIFPNGEGYYQIETYALIETILP